MQFTTTTKKKRKPLKTLALKFIFTCSCYSNLGPMQRTPGEQIPLPLYAARAHIRFLIHACSHVFSFMDHAELLWILYICSCSFLLSSLNTQISSRPELRLQKCMHFFFFFLKKISSNLYIKKSHSTPAMKEAHR